MSIYYSAILHFISYDDIKLPKFLTLLPVLKVDFLYFLYINVNNVHEFYRMSVVTNRKLSFAKIYTQSGCF